MIPDTTSKRIINYPVRTVLRRVINCALPILTHPTSYKSNIQFLLESHFFTSYLPISSEFHSIRLNFFLNLNLILPDWNAFQIIMSTTRPYPKCGEKCHHWWSLCVGSFPKAPACSKHTPSYCHIRHIRSNKTMQETGKNSKNIPVTWEMRISTGLLTVKTPICHYQ